MELSQVRGLYRRAWHSQPFERWQDDLHRGCGNFRPVMATGRSKVVGAVEARRAGGLDLVHVVKDLAAIERRREDIRRDDSENLFLVIQLGGIAHIEQHGRESVLKGGDCILIDSARPSTFRFDGAFSNQLSVHLPRQLMYSGSSVRFEAGTRIDRSDPMTLTIRSLVAKIMLLEMAGRSKTHLGQLLFDTVRFAFEADNGDSLTAGLSSLYERLEYVEDIVDRHLGDPRLSPASLAAMAKYPLRRLQEDYRRAGLTIAGHIREKRLTLVAQRLRGAALAPMRANISQIALSCGFNDVSYFNRHFRKQFGQTPSDYVREISSSNSASAS